MDVASGGLGHAGRAGRKARPRRDRARRQQHWAPDIIRSGDKYFLYYAAPGTQPKAAVGLLVGRTLDPASPDYKWEDGGPVVWSDGVEDSNAIDPGVLRDPTNGTLWLTYGSYFGYIRLVELDPKTGKRLHPEAKPVNIAINSEASVMIFHDGWYYLLVTHGSCCAGGNSSYNIRMGRSQKGDRPVPRQHGHRHAPGRRQAVRRIERPSHRAGHFGLLDLGDGVQKFSCHYEADLDRGGISVLDIRPLLWRDGWPVAGDNVTAGTYEIESARTGTALEMAVQGVPVGGARGRGGRGRGGAPPRTRRDAAAADSGAGRRASWEQLAGRPGRCPHGALHAAGAAEVGDHARRQRRRLSRIAVFQDHHRRHRSRACRDGGRRTHRRSRRSPADPNNSGASISSPTAPIG